MHGPPHSGTACRYCALGAGGPPQSGTACRYCARGEFPTFRANRTRIG